jgi:hypothetical protein
MSESARFRNELHLLPFQKLGEGRMQLTVYHFDVEFLENDVHKDPEGAEFHSDDAAIGEAKASLREMLGPIITGNYPDPPRQITIRCGQREVACVRSRDVLPPSFRLL